MAFSPKSRSRDELVAALRQAAQALRLPGRRVLLAVSGGPDSVAMLVGFADLAEELRLQLGVATIDHQLRPDSARDLAYARRLAGRLGVPFFEETVSVERGAGVEAGARRARYRALEAIARREGFDLIATAHTRDDQAETVLLRLARGTGTRGLRGILGRRGRIVRPMLGVSRAEVQAFLRRRRVRPRIDPTNASPAFDRNRVRALVLPALESALGASAIEALARAADVAADDERYLERRARRWAEAHLQVDAEGPEVAGDARALARLPAALRRRVLRRAAATVGLALEADHVARALAALRSKTPARVALPRGFELRVRYGRFSISCAQPAEPVSFDRAIDGEGRYEFPEAMVEVRCVRGAGVADEGRLRIDPARVQLPLRLRSRHPGDRFRPRGGHTRKLKAFLIDQKIPREAREGLVLLADSAGRVLSIAGVRDSDAAAEGERAEVALEIKVTLARSAAPGCRLQLANKGPKPAKYRSVYGPK